MKIVKSPEEFEVKTGSTDVLFLRGNKADKEKIYKEIDIPGLTVIEGAGLDYDCPYLEKADIAGFVLTGDDYIGLIEVALICTSLSAFTPSGFIHSYDYKYEAELQSLVQRYGSVNYGTFKDLTKDIHNWFNYLIGWEAKYGSVELPTIKRVKKNETRAERLERLLSET